MSTLGKHCIIFYGFEYIRPSRLLLTYLAIEFIDYLFCFFIGEALIICTSISTKYKNFINQSNANYIFFFCKESIKHQRKLS